MITVFTPTYNRAKLLPDLYNSLKRQTCRDFEWVVVDDGSTDETESLFRDWVPQADFSVIYVKKENGGKQRAVNLGVQLAKGDIFWIVDSDDKLTEDAIEKAYSWFDAIKGKEGFAGVAGLRGYSKTEIIGKTFKGEFVDASVFERDKYNIKGDKSEIFYTQILKKFPFPEFEGEKFVPEALVYNRIGQAGYKMRWYNHIVYIGEYLSDGYTKNTDRLLITNWKGYTLYVEELVASKMPVKIKVLVFGAWCLRGVKRLCRKY